MSTPVTQETMTEVMKDVPEKLRDRVTVDEFAPREGGRSFILADEKLHKTCSGEPGSWGWEHMGRCIALQAENQTNFLLNPTTQPGGTIGIFYGAAFEARKDGWQTYKFDEHLEISPVHAQYYQLTHEQKEKLEAKIKQGLAGIAQSVADLELVEHDIRKYKVLQDAFNEAESKDSERKRKGHLRLKAIFVDEVDHYTGGGGPGQPGRLSMAFMRNNAIMPTVVDDFMEMRSKEDLKTNTRFSNLPDVEKRMLEIKWNAYLDWLKLFGSAIDMRMQRLETLRKSRTETLRQYRDWLKPIITRYKLIEESFERSGERKDLPMHFIRSQGNAVSYNTSVVWIWKHLFRLEERMIPREFYAKHAEELVPLDEWTLSNLVFNFRHGLIADFPWITKEWAKKTVGDLFVQPPGSWISSWLKKDFLYYNFFKLEMQRGNIRMASGYEMEDTDFYCDNYVFSRNAMAAKCLEMKSKREEIEFYIDNIIGQKHQPKEGGCPIGYHKFFGKYWISKHFMKIMPKMRDFFGQLTDVEWSKLETGGKPIKMSKTEFFSAFGDKETSKAKFDFIEQPLEDDEIYEKQGYWLELFGVSKGGLKKYFFRNTGPYENNFFERITKFYFKWSAEKHEGMVNNIQKRMSLP